MFRKFIKKAIIIILIINSNFAFSQNGNPYITNFDIIDDFDNQNWAVSQDENGIMLFANRMGILTFDSKEWELVQTSDFPYSIKKDIYSNKIFIGCDEGFGFLIKNDTGNYVYNSLSDEYSEIGEITNIEFSDSNIYFYGNQSLTRVNPHNLKEQKQWLSNDYGEFSGILNLKNKIFINIQNKGLFVLTDDTLQLISDDIQLLNSEILFNLFFDENHVLFGTDENNLILFDGSNFTDFIIKDKKYLEECVLSSGINLTEDKFALSTLIGGCIIIDKKTKETVFTINYQSGLPGDEIFSMGTDKNNGLWLAHDYGLSRVNYNFPVRNFNSYPGLEGNLIAVVDFDNTIYVATSIGVFYLTEEEKKEEIEVLVKVPTIRKVEKTEPKPEIVKKEEKKELSKKELRLLKKKERQENRKKKINEILNIKPEDEKDDKEIRKKKYTYVRKKIYALLEKKPIFKKIEGIDEKCKQLIVYENRILVSTNTGLYEIKDQKVNNIKKDIYITNIYKSDINNRFYIGTDNGLYTATIKKDKWEINYFENFYKTIYSIVQENEQNLWLGSDNHAYKIELNTKGEPVNYFPYSFKSNFTERVIVRNINNKAYFFLSSGIYYFNPENDTIIFDDSLVAKIGAKAKYIYSQEGITWLYINNEWVGYRKIPELNSLMNIYLNLYNDIQYIYVDTGKNMWIIDKSNSLNKVLSFDENIDLQKFEIIFKKISNNEGTLFSKTNLALDYENSSLEFHIVAPYYVRYSSTQYQYCINGLMNDWSKWSYDSKISFPFIPSGEYVIKVRAKNILGKVSKPISLKFKIHPPFYETWWFYLSVFAVALVLIYLWIRLRERKLQKDKRILEHKVKLRTAEILKQRDTILEQKQEITDSIYYARRIQNAVLPKEDVLKKTLPEHFILFKPRDIVSGDYYWMTKKNEKTIIVAADCTGHGVPGAFMSMLGVSFLNEIVNKTDVVKADLILNELREYVKTTLSQTGEANEAKDGMDLALCIIDKKQKKLQYAGAYNPLYLFRKKELTVIKADKMPISIYIKEKDSFTNHEIKYEDGDIIYMFSDGYVDQFGGETIECRQEGGRKFKSKTFKKLLTDIQEKTMPEQLKILDNTLEKWKGELQQIDDILVIGIKL
ncbi:MAG: SpoIIE family protein phosphatase [Bacteroidales bacterium]|nr:SpoIIE family protein phosphatase [Bacteroidales bacterium]